MAKLNAIGYTCHHDPQHPTAPIAIINTCGFIGDAKEESINTILRFAARKAAGTLQELYVMGCLSERYLKELEQEIPEVDGWYGKFDYSRITDLLRARQMSGSRNIAAPLCPSASEPRILTTPSHYAYLKISEGCNRFCSYCAIPLITGRHTSRPMEDILSEVKWLVSKGVKEINVIAQDLSSYGLDIYHTHKL